MKLNSILKKFTIMEILAVKKNWDIIHKFRSFKAADKWNVTSDFYMMVYRENTTKPFYAYFQKQRS
jgi:hypothetical protein